MHHQQHPFIKRIVEQLPPEDRNSFSERQLIALHRTALSLRAPRHLVNIRWSFPWIDRGFYLVLLIGKEKRSRNRLLADKSVKVLPRVVVFSGILAGCMILTGLVYGQRRLAIARQREAASLQKKTDLIHPAAIPFKRTQNQCEKSYREWQDDECIDYEYNHSF